MLLNRLAISRLSLIMVLAFSLAGCAFNQVREDRYQQAVKLVDEGAKQLREGKLNEASNAFSVAAELAPLAAAVDGQGCVALLQGDFAKAEEFFNKAYEMDSSYDEALGNLALLMDITGRHEKAKALYNQAIEKLPEHVGLRNNRAALEYDRGARKMVVIQELEKAALIGDSPVIKANLERLKAEDEWSFQ
jgi:Flp pilus assembly protein TadD